MSLTPILQKEVDKIKPVDLVVGISAKDVETTIIHTMNVVGMGIQQYFSQVESLVVVSDGFSKDRTKEMAEMFTLPPAIKKIVTEDMNGGGKGSGVRTILEIARAADATCVTLVDGDLLSISPRWVANLAEPVLFGADLVVPQYIRDKYDGVITNNIVYPLIRSVFKADIRQPIGGEYGISRKLMEKLLEDTVIPPHFGVDIAITTTAATESMDIRETPLGLKIHSSLTKYIEPSEHLAPMFRQVVGTLFDLIERYEDCWRDIEHTVKVRRRENGQYYGQKPLPVKVDVTKLMGHFQEGFENHKDLLKSILPKDIFEKVSTIRMQKRQKVSFDPETWAKVTYHMAAAYKRAKTDEKKVKILDAFCGLWMGRFGSFVLETQDIDNGEAEKVIIRQAETFEALRPYLEKVY